MRWADLLVLLPAAPYRLAAFPFAAVFHCLCASGHLSLTARYVVVTPAAVLKASHASTMALVIPQPHERPRDRLRGDCGGCRTQTKPHYQHPGRSFEPHFLKKVAKGHLVSSRYIFLLAGGCLLAGTAMGSYAVLLLIPAAGSVLILLFVSPARAHTWVFTWQMSWQTLCHLALSSQELNMQDARPAVALSAIMLLTQKATSLALDIHEGLVSLQRGQGLLQRVLPLCSYLLSFPSLLGGPLYSFSRFQAQAESCGTLPIPLRAAGQQCLGALALQGLRVGLARGLGGRQGCAGWGCLAHVWAQALPLRLAYYLHWVLDEALLEVAGFGPEAGQGDLSFHDLWTLETTHRLAVFSRTWNKSTSRWLRRLVFQRCPIQPLLATFAFSAWWHGLRPGQVFGFLCWAVMVEADYRIHPFLSARATSQGVKLLYCGTTWVFRQLIVAYILVAVETESFSTLCLLWTSCSSVLPLCYGLALLLLLRAKKPKQN